jgi:hypothetical protein
MATSPASDTDEADDVDFTDEEIAESLKSFFAEVDADYAAAYGPLKKVFEAKGPPARESLEATAFKGGQGTLLEHGFSGELTDSAGHKRKYVDGKQVAHDGGPGAQTEGGGKPAHPPHIAADAPSKDAVLQSVADGLPAELKAQPGLLDKALAVAAKIYLRTFAKATELSMIAHRLAPEILDTAEDYENIGKQKTSTGQFASGVQGSDPFAEYLGLPGVVVLGSILPKVVGAAYGYVKSKRAAAESEETSPSYTDADRREIAEHVVGLWTTMFEELGVKGVAVPSVEDVVAYLAAKHAA